ncbi:hypothetical protein A4H97_28760 [Niastella yeongjuensis]|uniref:AAA family ATPase n=1 Tax=Niastella yeongjuensis TaxID=354355 RepID=A0A1V9ET47_9BACT|nr:SbcC/MukB-like Walker B domain-containing protein [Niastella yeongjuensis]OQP49333.1 hypothetical protein A4H97_28760 [Niastella yeongjuensis]SEP43352.1 Uncharacterized protein YPO0396 [Niastella yeongjuensis]
MQLSVFSTDSQKSGFRLQYMEIFNWGTFDDVVHSIRPMGETSLLTGANGSGKTTFVDALLTLIVPEKRYRFYNQSSGSEKKGDRTEETYVMGGYGSMNSESTGSLKTLYLRENKDEAYSILLAHFANEAEQAVTLFQVRYFSGGDMRRLFGIAHKALRIDEDFKPFDLNGQWKKALDQKYNKGSRKQIEWFDAASKYAQQLVHVLGMQSVQALQLFNQTVGIKVLGNLDEFIRTHMLEPRNMEESFQDLKKHLATLLDARRNIEKAEEQIKLLQPIEQHFTAYNKLKNEIEESEQLLQTARIWNSYTRNELLQQAIEESDASIHDIQQKQQIVKLTYDQLQEEERMIKNQIDQNKAGQRMQQLEKDVQDLELKKQEATQELALFASWCEELHLEEKQPADEATYQRIAKEANRKKLELETKQRLNEEDEYSAKRAKEKSDADKKKVEDELNNLLHSKNNMPSNLISIRKQLCDALNLDQNELPYIGELMQVRSDCSEWQPALEKLLRTFSLRLLVPDKYYKKVNKYINNNHLGMRLVYEHVTDNPMIQNPERDTVYEKLEFHPDSPLSSWVEQQIIWQFNHVCITDEKTLDRYEKAITLNGLVKNKSRHEKDDRNGKHDPSKYVMGWNNEKKKDFLIKRRNQFADLVVKANETLEKCKSKAERLQKQFYAITRIREHKGFADLDMTGIQRGIHKLQEQINGLRKANKELDNLKAQLIDIQQKRDEAESQRGQLLIDETRLKDRTQQYQKQQEALQPLLQHVSESDKDGLLQFQQQQAALLSEITLQNIDEVYEGLKAKQTRLNEKQRDELHKEENQLNKCINRIKNPSTELKSKFSPEWDGDVQHLPEDAAYANEYIDWLGKLVHENLPKYKRDFESFINDTITYKIGGLNEEMERWERDINNSVTRLNQSLGGINFNRLPDTYIQLGKRPVPSGTDIKEFRGRLLDALPQAANWQQSSFEEKSKHFTQKVQPLIDELDKNESYRNKVMDVRNWFEFWADERFRNTDEIKKTYRQMGQLSGGEKAQLTYTILCSAIAYQFGITREGKNSRSLRFIAVDESFSNQDEEKATYLMELCKQLHLQLLVVTPSDKIAIVQNFIAHVHLVQRVQNRHSVLYNMTIKELKEQVAEANPLLQEG